VGDHRLGDGCDLQGDGWLTLRKRIPMKGGDEYDGLTKWKKYLHWRPGERKRIKRRYNKRARRAGRLTCRDFAQSEEPF